MVNTDKTNFTEQTPSQVSALQNRRIAKDENNETRVFRRPAVAMAVLK